MATFDTAEDTLDTQRQVVFLQLRPLCVFLMKAVTFPDDKIQEIVQNIKKLHKTLEAIPDPSKILDFDLIQYIFFPLSKLYNNPTLQQSDGFIEGFLNCIEFLLISSWNNYMMPGQFRQLLILLVSIIGKSFHSGSKNSTEDNQIVEKNISHFNSGSYFSEETKLAGVKCIFALLYLNVESTEKNENNHFNISTRRDLLLTELRDIQLRIVIGRCVYVLLEIITTERLLQLRIITLETLERLIFCIEEPEIIAAFLPGVLSNLSKTLVKDQKENHQLLTKIVEVLTSAIYFTMNDIVSKPFISKTETLSELKDILVGNESINQFSVIPNCYVQRTKSWHKATKSQIKILISHIFTIRNHPSWQLRLAFVNLSYKLLFECTKSLDNCGHILIETFVFYLNDDYDQVSIPCKQHMESLRIHPNFMENLTPILKENFNSWFTSLPRYIIGLDENAKYNALSLIIGFVSLLGSEVQTVLNMSLQRFSDGLLGSIEFDTEGTQIIENRLLIGHYDVLSSNDSQKSDSTLPSFPRPHFKYIREQRVTSSISIMIRLFGYFGNVTFLIEHFLAYVRGPGSKRFHAQCLFVINEILLGASGIDIGPNSRLKHLTVTDPTNTLQDVKRISKFVLHEYIESDISTNDPDSKALVKLDKVNKVSNISSSSSIIESQNYFILINCLVLEGIANISRILALDFRIELMDALYPILEKVGETNTRLHETADIALSHISTNCGYSSKKALVFENVDYLVNTVSRKLNQIMINPKTPQVLTAMVQVVGISLLTYLDDSIEEIFDVLDAYHMKLNSLDPLANALFAIVSTISNSFDINPTNEEKIQECTESDTMGLSKEIADFVKTFSLGNNQTSSVPKEQATLEEIGQYFLNLQKSKEKNSETENGDDADSVSRNDENIIDEKPKPTRLQSICMKIIDKLLNFLTASSPQLRVLVLDVIRIALPTLQSIPYELYPLIHRIWPSVLNRLKDKEQFVVLSSARLIQEIAIFCGEFFTSRVVQDVWPSFQGLLSQQSTVDKEFAGLINYTFSRSYRLKKTILETIKVVVNRVSLSNKITSQIIDTLWPFLSEEINEELQVAARELFREFARINANTTWLVLRGLAEEYTFIAPPNDANMLNDIVWPKYLCRFPKGDKKNLFARNVKILLDEI
ncbi:19954_t:CDS:2 [Gigaspora margarita]|uniref:19954_t:CDS:1 n=1 Tax=Gigaspora margarita TaxID=4874 RepID=A0ABN7V479_GIGMA|nr:19954_t:CDS:2 [Gigaspora margarita]